MLKVLEGDGGGPHPLARSGGLAGWSGGQSSATAANARPASPPSELPFSVRAAGCTKVGLLRATLQTGHGAIQSASRYSAHCSLGADPTADCMGLRLEITTRTLCRAVSVEGVRRFPVKAKRRRTAPLFAPTPSSGLSDQKAGAPDRIRTCDLCLRRAALYPAELRVPGRQRLAERAGGRKGLMRLPPRRDQRAFLAIVTGWNLPRPQLAPADGTATLRTVMMSVEQSWLMVV